MELMLVQYAEPVDGDGIANRSLGPAGRAQAAALTARIRIEGPWDALYTEPSPAATETADSLAEATGLTPVVPAIFAGNADRMADAQSRADAVESLIAEHPGQRIILCTSPEVIDAVARRIFGAEGTVLGTPDHTGITRIKAARSGHREVLCLNETAHLRGGVQSDSPCPVNISKTTDPGRVQL